LVVIETVSNVTANRVFGGEWGLGFGPRLVSGSFDGVLRDCTRFPEHLHAGPPLWQIDGCESHFLNQDPEQVLALLLRGRRRAPNAWQIARQLEDTSAILGAEDDLTPCARPCVFPLRLVCLAELILPLRLKRACNDAIVWIYGLVPALGMSGLISGALKPESPLCIDFVGLMLCLSRHRECELQFGRLRHS